MTCPAASWAGGRNRNSPCTTLGRPPVSPDLRLSCLPVDPGQRMGRQRDSTAGTLDARVPTKPFSLGREGRPEMNPGYHRPRIKQRGFELFSNDQSFKRGDLRIRRLHAVRSRHRIFRRTGLMRRGPEPAPLLSAVPVDCARHTTSAHVPFSCCSYAPIVHRPAATDRRDET